MVPGASRSRMAVAAVGFIVFFSVLFGLSHFEHYEIPTALDPSSVIKNFNSQRVTTLNSATLQDLFAREIWGPSVALNQTEYKPFGAFSWKLPKGDLKWDKPLGESFCIIDLDSRSLEKEGEIFGPRVFTWKDAAGISGPSIGILQHWIYAKIHGYKYYYVRTEEFKDRRGSWKKPSIIGRLVEKHPACAFVDSDAIFNHLDLPFEWLLNYWRINETDSLAMALDPKHPNNQDEKGRVYANTGFIIAQNTPVLPSIMKDWATCADDGSKYTNCTNYRDKWNRHPSDQGGFGNYVRYDWDDHIKELPCTEANGYPESHSGCAGTFIKHVWTGKDTWLKVALGEQIPGYFLETFHKQMLADKSTFYITEKELMDPSWLTV